MIDIERIYKYMELLECRRHVTASEFQSLLEISKATFKRDLSALRDRFDVPIIYDRDIEAYKLDTNCNRKPLPGIWFSPDEIKILRSGCDALSHESNPTLKCVFNILHTKFQRLNI
jgi:predicted DNA-binding transcriptional regulator YafY